MTSALSLAGRVAALDDDALRALIADRVHGRGRIDDFFDLAEALLEPAAVQRALGPLDRDTLSVLAFVASAPGADAVTVSARLGRLRPTSGNAPDDGLPPESVPAALDRLVSALLVEEDSGRFTAYPEVRDRLTAWPAEGLPDAETLATAEEPRPRQAGVSAHGPLDALAAEHAFAAVAAVAELLSEFEREPARELQKGGLSLPDTRRLTAGLALPLEQVPVVLDAAERAALVGRDGNLWLPTADAARWLHLSTVRRWTVLAGAWLGTLPDDIRRLLSTHGRVPWGETLHEWVRWRYPAAFSELGDRLDAALTAAELLGITVRRVPSTAGTTLLEHGAEPAASILASAFPAEVERVYLQHDLSIVSPGPLAPELDTRLRTMADVESRALASTYRVSAGSLARAIAGGETAASLRTFLTSISLTGLPQPLEYLISDAAARFGRVRVRALSGERTRTAIISDDEPVLGTIEVDQSLAALAPIRDDGRLLSRLPRDVVYWALVDAGYPAAAEDESGRIENVVARRVAAPRPPDRNDDDRAAGIVRRLRAAPDIGQNSEAWLSRQLDAAVRSHTTLLVSVALPDGRELEFSLEPTGIGGGRLRARDRASDIERTLPLSSIRTVRPL
jgi:hypothetical protein